MARTKITSPKGIAVYPSLNKPDTKFDPDGVYKTTLKLADTEATQKYIAKIDAIMEENLQKERLITKKKSLQMANPPYKRDEEGNYLVNFKLKAKVTPKNGKPFTQKPVLLDAKKAPVTVSVGGGSTIRVGAEVNEWNTKDGVGITLWLKLVQVLELKEYDATSGFDIEEEDGWESMDSDPGYDMDDDDDQPDGDDGDF